MERAIFEFLGCNQIHKNSEINLPQKYINVRY